MFFGVQVSQRAVAFSVWWPVDAPGVGGAHAEAGYVGDIRRCDLDDVGSRAARDGQLCHLVEDRLRVGAGREHGQGPVHLEAELGHGPDRVMSLNLRDGDPRGGAFGCVVQRDRCASGMRGSELRDLLAHGGQGAQFAVHGLGLPSVEALRRGRFRRTGLPSQGAASLAFGAAGVLPGLLVQQPQRPP